MIKSSHTKIVSVIIGPQLACEHFPAITILYNYLNKYCL
jgi:hypothetical protein